MAHTVKIQEIINGVQITETIDGNVVEKLISYQSKPFLRTTNESAEETYQVLDIVGEIYNTPALATDFRIIDKNDNVFIPANGVELIAYSLKIRAFRPDADINEVLTIGAITTTTNSVTIGLHSSGTNAVRIDGLTYEKYYPDLFNFTPVTTGQKILIIHALPDAQVFHLAQGAESTEAVEPAYSGLFVARLLVTDEGIDIVEAVSGFREKSVDNFAIYSLAAGDRFLGIGSQMRLKVQSSGAIRIGGFYNEEDKIYNGCPISVRNDTPFPMEFYNAVDGSPEFMPINPDDLPFSIKPGETANFAWRGDVAEIVKTGGGAGKASEVENDSTVTGASVKDALETISDEIYLQSNVLKRYVHNSNIEITPTAIDYSTGYITCDPHGLPINAVYYGGCIPNDFKAAGFIAVAFWKSIPYEYNNSAVKIKIIDATTIQILDGSNNVISVNQTSTENNTNLDISKWHIEIMVPFSNFGIPKGHKNIKVQIHGLLTTYNGLCIHIINVYDMDNNVVENNISGDSALSTRSRIDGYLGGGKGLMQVNVVFAFDLYTGLNYCDYSSRVQIRVAGANNFSYTAQNTTFTRSLLAILNNGIEGIKSYTDYMYANGSIITVYKT